MFTFTGLIIEEEDGYSSLCPELDVASVGATPEEAQAMLLEGAFEDGLPYLRPVPADADPRLTDPKSIYRSFRFATLRQTQ